MIKGAFSLTGPIAKIEDAQTIKFGQKNVAETIISTLDGAVDDIVNQTTFNSLISLAYKDIHERPNQPLFIAGEALCNFYIQSGQADKAIEFSTKVINREYAASGHGNLDSKYSSYFEFVSNQIPETFDEYIAPIRKPRPRLSPEHARLVGTSRPHLKNRKAF
ncbi:hypothetical protein MED297_06539 [Reinekea sp. MED297]|uniref:Uncharacterized protein n=2 Tax=Reinekea TaxID=230494 RepID=A4BJN6_9GAMM|nr:hypothetical protein MED297_06539 [Reinekea sp. MED297] [Reinekea blandensis MED297]